MVKWWSLTLLLLWSMVLAKGAELYRVYLVPTNYPSGAKAWLVFLYYAPGEQWQLQKTTTLNNQIVGGINYGIPFFSLASDSDINHVWAVIPNSPKCFLRGRKLR